MTTKKINSDMPLKQFAADHQIPLSERVLQHPAFEWILNNGKNLIIAAALLIGALLLFYRSSNNYSANAEADYLTASQNFAYFQKEVLQGASAEVVEGKSFQELRKIIERRPELHAKYDGQLAQLLLLVGSDSMANEYAKSSLKRTAANGLPDYNSYSQTTLNVFANQAHEALVSAKELKQRMQEQASLSVESRNFGDLLYGYNLLRLATLQQKSGNQVEEKALWEELKQYAGWSPRDPSLQIVAPWQFEQLLGAMKEGSANLQSYIQEREKALSP